ncbi:protein tyrosine phosphatase [Methylobacterium organophilum]|uniref:tyrosine phosphatase family protein n=1 Tax=Methylobacterium organophilum TaxID=410 RepID=UPI001F135DEE|nr:protein tyrosine phosphatase [Methylobacterium organophilum]UMY16349.1 protein tyrosine phosphatase [Methylobacterium organophilum]
MPSLYVCSLSRLPETAASIRPSHLITLATPGTVVERPAAIPAERHLTINLSDIVAPLDGHVLPETAHVERFLSFVFAWERQAPLLIHCYAGISRSTAAAFIAACALCPARDEAELARELRGLSPSATPNARLVQLADAHLGREGRMVAAIAAIGRGEEAFEGNPFRLTLA